MAYDPTDPTRPNRSAEFSVGTSANVRNDYHHGVISVIPNGDDGKPWSAQRHYDEKEAADREWDRWTQRND